MPLSLSMCLAQPLLLTLLQLLPLPLPLLALLLLCPPGLLTRHLRLCQSSSSSSASYGRPAGYAQVRRSGSVLDRTSSSYPAGAGSQRRRR